MLRVEYWSDALIMPSRVRGYLLYSPPHRGQNWDLSRPQAIENYQYFLTTKDQRIQRLEQYTATWEIPFLLNGDWEEFALFLTKWLLRYSPTIVCHKKSLSFYSFRPLPLRHREPGVSVLYDVGTAFGETIRKEYGLDWQFYESELVNDPDDKESFDQHDSGHQEPCIVTGGRGTCPMELVSSWASQMWSRARMPLRHSTHASIEEHYLRSVRAKIRTIEDRKHA